MTFIVARWCVICLTASLHRECHQAAIDPSGKEKDNYSARPCDGGYKMLYDLQTNEAQAHKESERKKSHASTRLNPI